MNINIQALRQKINKINNDEFEKAGLNLITISENPLDYKKGENKKKNGIDSLGSSGPNESNESNESNETNELLNTITPEDMKIVRNKQSKFNYDMKNSLKNRNKNKKNKFKALKGNRIFKKKINILDDDIFNTVDTSRKKIKFKKLDEATRLLKLSEYIEKLEHPIDDHNLEHLTALVTGNKLYLKRDIIYDEVNEKINSIEKMQYIDGKYVFIDTRKKKKMSTNVKNIMA